MWEAKEMDVFTKGSIIMNYGILYSNGMVF